MENETNLQRLLHLVESAQRAGYSEDQIVEIVDDALDGGDDELDAAA